MLSQTDIRQFNEQGFVVVRGCVSEADAREAGAAVWADLLERYDVAEEPGTWHGQYFSFGGTALKGSEAMVSERMTEVLDTLLGAGCWRTDYRSKRSGTVFASLPRPGGRDAWTVAGDWHWDQGENRHLPTYTGLQVCTLLSETSHRDGGTLFVSGSHHAVAAYFHRTRGRFSDNYSAKRMQSFFSTREWFRDLDGGTVPKEDRVAAFMDRTSTIDGISLRVHEMTGKPGDVYLLHPLLVHAGPPNGGRWPRIMHRSFAWRPPHAA